MKIKSSFPTWTSILIWTSTSTFPLTETISLHQTTQRTKKLRTSISKAQTSLQSRSQQTVKSHTCQLSLTRSSFTSLLIDLSLQSAQSSQLWTQVMAHPSLSKSKAPYSPQRMSEPQPGAAWSNHKRSSKFSINWIHLRSCRQSQNTSRGKTKLAIEISKLLSLAHNFSKLAIKMALSKQLQSVVRIVPECHKDVLLVEKPNCNLTTSIRSQKRGESAIKHLLFGRKSALLVRNECSQAAHHLRTCQ